MNAAGLGRVTYRDARIDGLELPQEAGVGISFRPTGPLLLALDLSWIGWSGSMKKSTLRATNPDNPATPPVLEVTSDLNWRDQYVVALGLAFDAAERTVLRAGYNYGRNPIPDETMNPLLATFAQHHVTLGAGYNPQLPFGPGAQERGEAIVFHFMVSRSWE